ncbi:hypothetical protein B9P52_24325 [Achromobacter denitrificans]|nr:hypothetical protein B9P52_24325 [Achromobacter denitrificans]
MEGCGLQGATIVCWNLSQAVLAPALDRFIALNGSEEHRKGGGIQPSFAETARGVLRAEWDVHSG